MSYKDFLKSRQLLVFALLLGVGLIVFFMVSIGNLPSGKAFDGMTPFSGGSFEASGVVQVPGTNGVLFVDDERPDEVFWMNLDQNRRQAGPIKAVKFGASVIDLEGITTDGSYIYMVGSQSKPQGPELAGLVRFKFNAQGQQAEGTEVISGLKRYLAENVPELNGMSEMKYEDGGINIEGIAWDPQHLRLLLGLRSPIVKGQALLVPIRLREPKGNFSYDNLEVEETIKLALGGGGIRSIEFDERSKAFRVISGAGPNSEKLDFKVWEWNGDSTQGSLQETRALDRRLKPEGITRFSSGDQDFTFIVFDTSGYAATD